MYYLSLYICLSSAHVKERKKDKNYDSICRDVSLADRSMA